MPSKSALISTVHCKLTGPSASHGTLLIHGAGGSPESNFPFQADLPGRTVAPYHPGSGPAPAAEGCLDVDLLADNALKAADHAELDTMDVVGYSLGTTIAIRIAATQPGRVRRLVLFAGFAHASPSLTLSIESLLALQEHGIQTGDMLPFARLLTLLSSSEHRLFNVANDPAVELTVNGVVELVADSVLPQTAAQFKLVSHVDVRGDLARITAPTTVVVPTADRLVDQTHSDALFTIIPNAKRIQLTAGHNLGWEAPEQMKKIIMGP